jgi:hypothetical protein
MVLSYFEYIEKLLESHQMNAFPSDQEPRTPRNSINNRTGDLVQGRQIDILPLVVRDPASRRG